MTVRCAACNSAFRVRAESVPAAGARTQCPLCKSSIVIPPSTVSASSLATGTDGSLFDLPPMQLMAEPGGDDLFGLWAREDGDGPPLPEISATTTLPIHDEAAESSPPPARRGLRRWLSRIFGSGA